MQPRRIAVVTATRAEYGLLYWLLRALEDDAAVALQLIVTGAHLSPRFGMTVRQIEADGFTIKARVPLDLDDDSELSATQALATATTGLAAAYARLRPELVVLLGDRYEMLGAAQAALLQRIPVAHLHGGESTQGAIDEAIRHAITKMAHLHFVAAEPFRKRVIQLGEAPDRVWTVGATGLDAIARTEWLGRDTLEADIGIALARPTFLVTYHPETLLGGDGGARMASLLEVLDTFGGSIVVTGVNADPGNASIRRAAQAFAEGREDRVRLVESLGSRRYLSLMKEADVVVGNSSSGLLEAPAVGTPSVDVGHRQEGRPRAPSVLHCSDEAPALREAVRAALSDEHRLVARRRETPYGTAGAAGRIADVIRSIPLDGLLIKRFHDLTPALS